MLRALVLISAIVFFRTFLLRPSRRSPTAISPHMNSLDGLLSAEQISQAVDEVRLRELQMRGQYTFAPPNPQADDLNPAHQRSASVMPRPAV
jgi:hypothetical protein